MLYIVESAGFTFLMNQTGLSWGNLSAHLTRPEEAGYIELEKSFKRRRPKTNLRLTDDGRNAFKEYRQYIRQILEELPQRVQSFDGEKHVGSLAAHVG